MLKYPQAGIAVFAREPVAGKVKTRLMPALGAQGACAVHKHLMARQFDILQTSKLCNFQLWVDSNPHHPLFSGFNGEIKLQREGGLGMKMQETLTALLDDFTYGVIIGSDCPGIDEAYLEQAIQALRSGSSVVLGPAADGGYVLIGMSRLIPEIFQEVSWGSSNVLKQTRERLRRHNIHWTELSTLYDIDRPEDLVKLRNFQFPFNST